MQGGKERRTRSSVACSDMGSHESLGLGATEECYVTVDMQFFIALMQMKLDGALADRQFARDFFIAQATGRKADDFELT